MFVTSRIHIYMALETERCSPNNASSPGPTDNNRRPGMDDCSNQTRENVSPPHDRRHCKSPVAAALQQSIAAAVVPVLDVVGDGGANDDTGNGTPPPTISAFRRTVQCKDAMTDQTLPSVQYDRDLQLACSKPLSICSPLQNKTVIDCSSRLVQHTPPPLLRLSQQPAAANRKKPHLPNKVAAAAADVVPRWTHLQHFTPAQQQHNNEPAGSQPHPTAAAVAAVEYTMAVAAAAAAAAAGHMPPATVFPFNSWMYRFNFLPVMPAAAAAEYFREMHHYQNSAAAGESPEIDETQPPAGSHPHLMPFDHHQQTHLHRATVAIPPLSVPPPTPSHSLLSQTPHQPLVVVPSRSATGYVSRPTSTSGSSDVSSSYGGVTATSVAGNCCTTMMMASKNRYNRSPSPRSPSPFPLAFSVDNILRPEFGSKLGHHHHPLHQQQHTLPQQQQRNHLHHHPYHNNNNNGRSRPSSASPPSPVSVVKHHLHLHHYDSVTAAVKPTAPLGQSLQPSPPSLVIQHHTPPPPLHRPAPTRPNAAAAPPKRPMPVTTAAVTDKSKRKPPPLPPPPCSPVDNNNCNSTVVVNGGTATVAAAAESNRLKPDDSGGNTNNNDDDQESDATGASGDLQQSSEKEMWPAWVYCTRYSDRPSSGKRKNIRKNIIIFVKKIYIIRNI